MKIKGSVWFTTMQSNEQIGIVLGVDEITKKEKAYIGIGFGKSEKSDEIMIAERGAKFPLEQAKQIIGR